MPQPPSNHIVNGHVYTQGEMLLYSATVLLTHTSSEETLTTTTNSAGEYSLNLRDLTCLMLKYKHH